MIKRNIKYADHYGGRNFLDVVYEPGKKDMPVIFFVHGGSWITGSKDMYTRLGENFLTKGFVTVLINYRLFPIADAYGMADDCRAALKWVRGYITEYGGNPGKIFMTGHSAGGHLAAVAGMTQLHARDYIAGFIMIDAFGLSAYYFLTEHGVFVPHAFSGVFGTEKEKWPLVCPDKLVRRGLPPFMILTGSSSYPFLVIDNKKFAEQLKENHVGCRHYSQTNHTHLQMILQFENQEAKVFKMLTDWMNEIVGEQWV
jgi:arylformamidase